MISIAVSSGPESFELRSYECPKCGHAETRIEASDRLSPTPWVGRGGEPETPKQPEAASASIPQPASQPPSTSQSANSMPRPIKEPRPKLDLEAEALAALEEARAMPPGPERTEAMKRAGILRNAADLQGVFFAQRGRPPKD
jgi:hypothetical protein